MPALETSARLAGSQGGAAQAALRLLTGLLALIVGSGVQAGNGLDLPRLDAACLASIEEVYWNDRDWPAANSADKPAFEAHLEPAVFSRRQERIRKEAALLRARGMAVSDKDVQAELLRMVLNSQAPARLAALFEALDGDVERIADCLVRPILIERALRPAGAGSADPFQTVPVEQGRDAANEVTLTLPAIASSARGGGAVADEWLSTARLPDGRRNHVSVWTGSEVLIWGGTGLNNQGARYDPATDSWRAMTIDGEPDHRRWYATAIWTGTEMVVWGGWGFESSDNVLATGGAYDPVADAWREVTPGSAPSARAFHTAVWTGEEMLVWGGCPALLCDPPIGDGAAWDPDTNTWRTLAATDAPAARGIHTAVWTGSEMLVWGGCESFNCANPYQDGAAYDPQTDGWSPMAATSAPDARFEHTAVWSGNEMIVWGGQGGFGLGFLASGGRYDPVTDSWSATTQTDVPTARRFHTAVWSSATAEMIVWGGCIDSECSQSRSTGGRYDPAGDTWQATAITNAASSRSHHTAVWTGSEMVVWGGCGLGECQVIRQSGGRYDPSADSWQATADPGEPSARLDHTAVWTGAEMIVFGGVDSMGFTLTGGEYDPATDSWSALPVSGTAGQRTGHTAVWTGTEMLIWGGRMTSVGTSSSGAVYDPATGTWTELPTTGAPAARAYHGAAWTGSEMFVFGGCAFSDCATMRGDGGAFDPASGTWRALASADAPSARFLHTVDWTGSRVLVWGGQASSGAVLGDGAAWNPVTDEWSAITGTDAPSARARHAAAWTGSELLVWGGRDGVGALGDGAAYDPGTDAWAPLPAGTGAPSARHGHTAVWTGSELLVWGGCTAATCDSFNPDALTSTGAAYSAAAAVWSPMSVTSAPFGRENHTALWADDRMIVWGGWRGFIQTDSGGRYLRPSTGDVIFRSTFESGGAGD